MLRDKVRETNALSINEVYETIQGEGLLVGTPSIFIRFQGCNLRCPWCDQPSALEFKKDSKITLKELMERIKESPFKHVVITGGEPFAHRELPILVKELLKKGYSVQIETNGTLWHEEMEKVAEKIHITCSPKAVVNFFVHPKILKYAKELKFVIDEVIKIEDILKFRKFLKEGKVILQPESNRKEMFIKARDIQRALANMGYTVRIIPQVHKFLNIP